MKQIIFTIAGNQLNKNTGNPIPYLRVTGRALWTTQAKRYNEWKNYVRWSLYEVLGDNGKADLGNAIYQNLPPLRITEKADMHLKIYYNSKGHADSDNVFKGIADALFENDKLLAGAFDWDIDGEHPRVEVLINF